jgi:hypothetical protein
MFIVVFSFFVLAVAVLSVVTVRWAIHRDAQRRNLPEPPSREEP